MPARKRNDFGIAHRPTPKASRTGRPGIAASGPEGASGRRLPRTAGGGAQIAGRGLGEASFPHTRKPVYESGRHIPNWR